MQCITKELLSEFHRAASTDIIHSIAVWQEQQILPSIFYLLIVFMYSRSLKISSHSIIFNYYSAWEDILAWPLVLLQPSRTLPSFSIPWGHSCLSRVQGTTLLSLLGGTISSVFYLSSRVGLALFKPLQNVGISGVAKIYFTLKNKTTKQNFEDFTIYLSVIFCLLGYFCYRKIMQEMLKLTSQWNGLYKFLLIFSQNHASVVSFCNFSVAKGLAMK